MIIKMSNLSARVFKRLDIAYNSHKLNEFFLEQLAHAQWKNKAPFIHGPFMEVKENKEEYGYWDLANNIEHSLRYYMKPHRIIVFGNDINNTLKPYILTRCWLNATHHENRALVFMERIQSVHDLYSDNYWRAINNNSWVPTHWSKIQSATQITQSLIPKNKSCTNDQCTSCYNVSMLAHY
jgi:hypothetical protein